MPADTARRSPVPGPRVARVDLADRAQVEYANKAVENSGTAIGLRVKDGVVLAVEKLVLSKLLVPGSNQRIATVDDHAGMVRRAQLRFVRLTASGLCGDPSGRQSVGVAGTHRGERLPISVPHFGPGQGASTLTLLRLTSQMLADRLGGYCQAFTLYGSVRPFGLSSILGGIDKLSGPELYCIEPSGVYWVRSTALARRPLTASQGYRGCAVGKGRQLAKTEIEKLNLEEMTCREAVDEAARIIHTVHDEAKDKDFELELSWISTTETGGRHLSVPKELIAEAERKAKCVDLQHQGVYSDTRAGRGSRRRWRTEVDGCNSITVLRATVQLSPEQTADAAAA